jgi:hypothetical protein
MSLLKQPMALITVAMLVMVIVVPRMMGGMSDEEKREMATMQQSMSITGFMKNMEQKGKLLDDRRILYRGRRDNKHI